MSPPHPGPRRLLAACLILVALPAAAAPLPVRNNHPLVQVHGLPGPQGARPPAPGQWRQALRLDLASHYTVLEAPGERLVLDGESLRLEAAWWRGFRGLALGLVLPWVAHRGGAADTFIRNWHEAFGLPQGGRDEAPVGRLLYRYERDGRVLLDLERAAQGPGDLRLLAARPLRAGATGALALYGALTLPTGDPRKLTGSGAPEAALWLEAEGRPRRGWRALDGDAALGVLFMGRTEVLGTLARRRALFGRLGLGLDLSPRFSLRLELAGHSALYRRSELRPLADYALLLGMGGALRLADGWRLHVVVQEDVAVHTAADVALVLRLDRQAGQGE